MLAGSTPATGTKQTRKESNHMHDCNQLHLCHYEPEHCGITDGSGYTYLCDTHRREKDVKDAKDADIRWDAHISLLRRVDDPNDSFNEDDLERITTS